MLGIHLACAAAADAYAAARLAGHPVVALLVGKAMSGAFLAHGYQANRILALADDGVLVHAMGREAAARVTRRTVAELDRLGEQVPPMAYGIRAYAGLGLLHRLIEGVSAEAPGEADIERVRAELAAAVADIRASGSPRPVLAPEPPLRPSRAGPPRSRCAGGWPSSGTPSEMNEDGKSALPLPLAGEAGAATAAPSEGPCRGPDQPSPGLAARARPLPPRGRGKANGAVRGRFSRTTCCGSTRQPSAS